MKIKKILALVGICVLWLPLYANHNDVSIDSIPAKNGFGAKLVPSVFHIGLDLQTKYIWRGMEMMSKDASPVLFPQISYQDYGVYLYVMGGYAFNGKYSEVDWGISYTYKWLTIGFNDYYYPTIDTPFDKYFNFNKASTGHWYEAVITLAPPIPIYITASNFFYGADKDMNGKQAYSTYVEAGTWFEFLMNNRISLAVGIACNKSCYNDYSKSFSVNNIELKYTYTIHFRNGWTMPIGAAFIVNPYREKAHINFTASVAL
ncbi:MAG TPA: hypothetical protein DIW30_06615 [Bacteroidales bacterium]|nr:hypothetical protein [Bacteroidales bacterium]